MINDHDELYLENIILRKIFLSDNDYISLMNNIFKEQYFENKEIAKIVNMILVYRNQHNQKIKKPYLLSLIKGYCNKNEKDFIVYRNAFENCLSDNYETKDNEKPIAEAILLHLKSKATYHTIMDNLDKIQQDKDTTSCMTEFNTINNLGFYEDVGFNYFEQQDQHWDNICNPESRMLTNYNDIDRVTNGGFPVGGIDKCLITFVAKAGLGKSLMMSNLALKYLENNLNVVIISMELSELMYGTRIDAHIADSDINLLKDNQKVVRNQIQTYRNMYPESNLLIKEYPPNTINTNTIQGYLNKVCISKFKPDVVFIDYLNLVNPSGTNKNANSYEKVGDVARELRALSYQFGCPIITATQINRSGYDLAENTDMEQVSESMGICHTSDMIMALFQGEGDREAGRLKVKVIKNRYGIIGSIFPMAINYNSLKISNWENDNTDMRVLEQELVEDLSE